MQSEWQRVRTVVESASELSPELCEPFVERSLPDRSLCRRELELLSESDDGKWPEHSGPAVPAAGAPDWPLLGKSLNRFDLVGAVGRGGMGASSAVSNFTGEARLASSLNHPGHRHHTRVFVTDNLPAGVAMYGATATTSAAAVPAGSPYFDIGPIVANGIITFTLRFTRKATRTITCTELLNDRLRAEDAP